MSWLTRRPFGIQLGMVKQGLKRISHIRLEHLSKRILAIRFC